MSEYKDVHCTTFFYIGPRYSLFINFVCNGRVLSFGGNFVHMNKPKSQITECLTQVKGLRNKNKGPKCGLKMNYLGEPAWLILILVT